MNAFRTCSVARCILGNIETAAVVLQAAASDVCCLTPARCCSLYMAAAVNLANRASGGTLSHCWHDASDVVGITVCRGWYAFAMSENQQLNSACSTAASATVLSGSLLRRFACQSCQQNKATLRCLYDLFRTRPVARMAESAAAVHHCSNCQRCNAGGHRFP